MVSKDHFQGPDAGSLTHHSIDRDKNSPMLIAGLIVLVVAIGLITTAVLQRKRGLSLAGSEELAVSDVLAQITAAAAALGPGNYRKHVAVSGQLVPSPQGELLSPLTRTPCVWHRTVIRRRHYEWITENNQRRRQETTSLEHEASSEHPFGISDGTATLAIDPSKARIDGAEKVLDVYEPQMTGGGLTTGVDVEVFGIRLSSDSGDDTLGYQREETVLRPGAAMHVIGTVSDRSGAPRIADQDGTRVQISTRSRSELVSSTVTKAQRFMIAGSVMLVVGLVLTIIGLVR